MPAIPFSEPSNSRTCFSYKSINGRDSECASHATAPEPPATWRASLTFFPKDIVIERALTNRQAAHNAGGTRGPISRFSRKSKTRFLLTVRAMEGLRTFITLTYANAFPGDTETIRSHWERLRKWFTRRGLGGVWKRERQERGAVHLHLLLTGDVDSHALREQWEKVSGNGSAYAVDVRPITDPEGLCRYLAKDAGQRNAEGSGFRMWGVFGGAKPAVVEQVVGTLHDLAPLLRVARRLDDVFRRANGLPARRDDGKRGCILWDASSALRKYLPRLLALYGLDGSGARPKEGGRGLAEDAGNLKRCPGCKKAKERREYHKDSTQTDGLHQYCKPCKSARDAAHYDANSFKYIARNFNAKALRVGVVGTVSGVELEAIFRKADGACARCGSPDNPHFDHARSFACKGPNTAANIQLLCRKCSLWKGRRCMDFRLAVY